MRLDWGHYALKYIKEEIDYQAVIAGLFLMFVATAFTDLSIEVKIVINVLILLVSLFYKNLNQIFSEK